MLKLYQREGCPHTAKVRRFLETRGVSFVAMNVPKLASERREVLALPGVTSPEVPVLVDGETVVQGSDSILEYLTTSLPETSFGDPAHGLTRTLRGLSYSDAVPAVKEALATEGFGVLTEIDVRATMKKKLDLDIGHDYVILGACNPAIAHRALTAEPAIGLLLPCNVVVTEDSEGNAVVSAVDPREMFKVVNRPEVEPLADEVGASLRRVLAALPST